MLDVVMSVADVEEPTVYIYFLTCSIDDSNSVGNSCIA